MSRIHLLVVAIGLAFVGYGLTARHQVEVVAAPCPPPMVYTLAHVAAEPHVHVQFAADAAALPVPGDVEQDVSLIPQLVADGKYLLAGALVLYVAVLLLSATAKGWWGTRYGKIALVAIGSFTWGGVEALFLGRTLGEALVRALIVGLTAAGGQALFKNLLQGNSTAAGQVTALR